MDATRVETATLAAKIRKLAMYAQQLAETGIKAEVQVAAFLMETATWRPRSGSWLCTPSSWLKQVLKQKDGQVDALRVEMATMVAN